MVVLGVSLRFIQETKADNAAAKLKAMIKVTATVVRDGQAREIPLKELVPGDIVKLSAGDMIPADVRLITAKDLFIIQATLTGESMPVEKTDARDPRANVQPIEHTNLCFLGTSVESGSATAVIVATGAQTYFGKMASSLAGQQVETAFDKGVKQFTWLMIRFMVVMVPLVFVINGFTKHDWKAGVFLRAGRRRGPDAGNAADDRFGLPVQRRAWPCPGRKSSSSGSTPSRTSAPWMCSAPTRPARSRLTTSSWKSIATSSRMKARRSCATPISSAISRPA